MGPRSDFSKPCQGAAEKSANATRRCCLVRGSHESGMSTGTAAADAPSSGLGSFFILQKRGVEQHGRPMVRTMIWTNNPLDESGRCLCFTETAA